ncbi:MAG TPA: ABC transporter permease [Tenuifilaceae bacterium]|nr:ABC transporter permease [Tenuifilaceae bacterium]
MIWSVSWRNVWRSKTRSLVIITAITLGVFAGVYTVAFMFGWVNQRVASVINTEMSHIQIHHPEYLETYEIHDLIPNTDEIVSQLSSLKSVKAVSDRVIATCMVASAETGSGVQLVGVDPEREMLVTNIHQKVVDGEYFNGVKTNPIVIGEKLAEKLKVKVRSKVVVTITEMDGTLTGGAFRVAGIYRTSNTSYDEMKAFVRADDIRRLVGLDENAGHEIAVLLNENGTEKLIAKEISEMHPNLQVLTWTQLLPEMEMLNENMNLMLYIFVGIILLALGFGIVNTMLMVILERVKELGMLMAVGMNRLRVFTMIVLETVFLSLTGGIIGIVLAVMLTAITGKTGIDLSLWAQGLNSFGYDSVIYPEIGFDSIVGVTILVIITGVISAIYPARKAIKLKPAEAIRIDM